MYRKLLFGTLAIALLLTACCALAEGLVLPEGLTRIESQAFAGLDNIGTVTFPESVTAIADDAFKGTTFTGKGFSDSFAQSWCNRHDIPFEVLDNPASDFEYRVLDDGRLQITGYIGSSSNVMFPSAIDGKTVVSLARELFYNNYWIETVHLPATIEYFGDDPEYDEMTYVFSYCRSLTSITVARDNPSFCSEDGVLYRHVNGQKTVLYNYPCAKAGTEFTVPATVTTLDCTSFAACKSLKTLYLTRPDIWTKGYTFYDDGQMTVYYRPGGKTEDSVAVYMGLGHIHEINFLYPEFVSYGGYPAAGADELGVVYEVKREPVGEGVRISWEPARNADSYRIYRQVRYPSYRTPMTLYLTTENTEFLEETCSEDVVYDYMIVSCRGYEEVSSKYHGYIRFSAMDAPRKETDEDGNAIVTWDSHSMASSYELYVSGKKTTPTESTVPTCATQYGALSVPVDTLLNGVAGYVYIRPVCTYIDGYIVRLHGAWSKGVYIKP